MSWFDWLNEYQCVLRFTSYPDEMVDAKIFPSYFFTLNFWAIKIMSLEIENPELFKRKNNISGHNIFLFGNLRI